MTQHYGRAINPTGLGYRFASNVMLGLMVLCVLLALPMLATQEGFFFGLVFLQVAGFFFFWFFVLRVISDFLAVLRSIAQAVRDQE